MNGKELLTLATGEYTLVYLRPVVDGVITVKSTTVIYEDGVNRAVDVRESRKISLESDKTYYLTFKGIKRGPKSLKESMLALLDTEIAIAVESKSGIEIGVAPYNTYLGGTSFAPILISEAAAIEVAEKIKAVGNALNEPITRSE